MQTYSMLSESCKSLMMFLGKCHNKVYINSLTPIGEDHFEMVFKCQYSIYDLKSIIYYSGAQDKELMKNELTLIED